MRWRIQVIALLACALTLTVGGGVSATALLTTNNTPFPRSPVLAGARWTSQRHGPPNNQFGDILATAWAPDDNLYTLIDDGATDSPGNGALWRNSFAQIKGSPPRLTFRHWGNSPPAASWDQIVHHRSLWTGPLGSHYALGLGVFGRTFFATAANDWNWKQNRSFRGLSGIAYSTDGGRNWHSASKPFPGPTGNLNWVQYGRGRAAPDGYAYAIASDREFNASRLILGRSRPDVADITDPTRWQWVSGTPGSATTSPGWSPTVSHATPVLSWANHITYPRMSYDRALKRYLLTFTYSYAPKPPDVWKAGSELVIMDARHPWGPFSFVARGSYFGPSNGYDPAFPVKWISSNGLDLWMIWAANFVGCKRGLSCAAAYGFNYQRLRLELTSRVSGGASGVPAAGARAADAGARSGTVQAPPPPAAWRGLPPTPPPFRLGRPLGPAGG